jgi:site-specific recombinase XerD
LPIEPVDDYLHWLRARRCSTNTLETYAQHLAWLFTFFDHRGIVWEDVEFRILTDFLVAFGAGAPPLWRRGGGRRSDSTLRGASAAIKEFYEYQRIESGRGPANLRLTRTRAHAVANEHHFLAHVEKRHQAVERNALVAGLDRDEPPPRLIDFEHDFAKLLDACRTYRDRALLSAFYDLGLRVGAARGLHTGDLNLRKRRVTVTRREDNPNGALSKRHGSFDVDEGNTRFFDFYREYLLEELLPAGIENDLVFVNLRPPVGRAMSYSNVYDLCRSIGQRAGLDLELTPHVLRHTHATALAKAGWTSAEIAARLGQRNASSADVYIHLANDDLVARMQETQHLVWPGIATEVDDRS